MVIEAISTYRIDQISKPRLRQRIHGGLEESWRERSQRRKQKVQPDRWIENQKERVGKPGQEKGARRREEPRVPNARKTATEFSFPTRKVEVSAFRITLQNVMNGSCI